MATTWRFALFLCVMLLGSGGPSLASEEPGTTAPSGGHGVVPSSGPAPGHGDTGDGHGGEPITTLPIVTWKWHHVSTPYMVALWILVSWLCKISEFHRVRFHEELMGPDTKQGQDCD
ncbi:sodium/hydrogen exchanger 3 [Pleuronectes platessa]|uniref:sodium/hydrogen exchanger 3 n=1 Tax=Pleuronectes platessa TaxID=8262 RepID=UPI00232A39D7|nr:sodium/hydrogen exchanger 3 [Pleuronectes platessa]